MAFVTETREFLICLLRLCHDNYKFFLFAFLYLQVAKSMTPQRFHQLRAFMAVCQTGSVSAAARMMHLSQPAITKLIRHLEAETGTALFDRARRRLAPTDAAHVLMADLKGLFGAMRNVDVTLNGLRHAKGVQIRIAAMPAIGTHLLPGALPSWIAVRPELRFSLSVLSSLDVHHMVGSNGADIGFALPVQGTGSVTIDRTLMIHAAVVAPHGHPLTRARRIRVKDLVRHRLIFFSQQFALGNPIGEYFSQNGLEATSFVETQNSACACAMVQNGLGVAVVDVVTAFAHREQLTIRPLDVECVFPVQVIVPPGVSPGNDAKRLAALCTDQIALINRAIMA